LMYKARGGGQNIGNNQQTSIVRRVIKDGKTGGCRAGREDSSELDGRILLHHVSPTSRGASLQVSEPGEVVRRRESEYVNLPHVFIKEKTTGVRGEDVGLKRRQKDNRV